MRHEAYMIEIEGISEIIYELSEASKKDLWEVMDDLKNRLNDFEQRDSDMEYILGICEECEKLEKCIYSENRLKCPEIIQTIDEYKS